MEAPGRVSDAVRDCIKTRDHPVMEVRDEALAEVARVLEDLVREHLDDEDLAVSLDGLDTRRVVSDGEAALRISGAFYTLGLRKGSTGDRLLPMEAHLSIQPGAMSVVRVADRRCLFGIPESERQFQRALESAVWRHTFELRLS